MTPAFGARPTRSGLPPFAVALIAARTRLGLTVREFAQRELDIAESTLRRIETGRVRNPQGETRVKVAKWAARRGIVGILRGPE